MDYDQEIERQYHPENFEPEGYESQKDYEESVFNLDLERLFGLND